MLRHWEMRAVALILFFALTAGVGTSFLAPKLLAWYASPPVPIGVSCDTAIHWGMDKLILSQTMGLAIGGALGALISIKTSRRSKSGQPSASAEPAKPPQFPLT
jgi:hypothetical protein